MGTNKLRIPKPWNFQRLRKGAAGWDAAAEACLHKGKCADDADGEEKTTRQK
jgi:hypothetical protein